MDSDLTGMGFKFGEVIYLKEAVMIWASWKGTLYSFMAEKPIVILYLYSVALRWPVALQWPVALHHVIIDNMFINTPHA